MDPDQTAPLVFALKIKEVWITVCIIGYQSTSTDDKADSICCEWQEKG